MVGTEGRSPEGDIPYLTYRNILEGLPSVRFENATDILEEIRLIKSDEELRCIEKSQEISDLAVPVLHEMAREGVNESEIYAKMVQTMLANGSETPVMFSGPRETTGGPFASCTPGSEPWSAGTSSSRNTVDAIAGTSARLDGLRSWEFLGSLRETLKGCRSSATTAPPRP